jgi:hypothetical protein
MQMNHADEWTFLISAGSNKWYYGPEVPGVEPMPEGGFKDRNFEIKKVVSCNILKPSSHNGANIASTLARSGLSLPCLRL